MSHRTSTGRSQSVKTRENYTCEEHIRPSSSMGRCSETPGMLELRLVPSSKHAMLFPMYLCHLYEFNLYAALSKRSTTKTNNRIIAKSCQQKSREPCHSLKIRWCASELMAFPLRCVGHTISSIRMNNLSMSPRRPWESVWVLRQWLSDYWSGINSSMETLDKEVLHGWHGMGWIGSLRFHHDTWNGIQYKT